VRDRILIALDLLGTFLFAIEGSAVAVAANFDMFGVLVIAFVSALGGGIVRDIAIGAVPPKAIQDWRYASVAFVAGLCTFAIARGSFATPAYDLAYLDAAALALFAIAGAQKALDYRVPPLGAILLGGVTAVGGGVTRDVLTAHVPLVLRADVYATAALAGAAVLVVALRLKVPQPAATGLGIAVCFGLRVLAYVYHWNLPNANT
jgi:uncharacterized membrane protein YeiH